MLYDKNEEVSDSGCRFPFPWQVISRFRVEKYTYVPDLICSNIATRRHTAMRTHQPAKLIARLYQRSYLLMN
jgi:hypothetical protein